MSKMSNRVTMNLSGAPDKGFGPWEFLQLSKFLSGGLNTSQGQFDGVDKVTL